MKILEPEYIRSDKRGSLIQLITGDWKQANYLKIKKGNSFGGHYHSKKVEFFYVISGSIEVKITIKSPDGAVIYPMKDGGCFLIEPYDYHTIIAKEDTEIIELLSMPFCKEDVHE